MKRKLALQYNLLVGLCDAVTGILLVLHPELTLKMMFISNIPNDLVYMRFIGAFVFSVGASYLIPSFAAKELQISWMKCVWIVTALIRTSVSLLVISQIASGDLDPAWITVSIVDALFAVMQIIFLRIGVRD